MSTIIRILTNLQPHTKSICKSTALRATPILCRHLASVAHDVYEKPANVLLWEKLAEKELSKSRKSVDSLRTERVTPVS
jgi:hypothetical protein